MSPLPGLHPPLLRLLPSHCMPPVQRLLSQVTSVSTSLFLVYPPPKYYCILCDEEGHRRRSRFCKSRTQSHANPASVETTEIAVDTAPPGTETTAETTATRCETPDTIQDTSTKCCSPRNHNRDCLAPDHVPTNLSNYKDWLSETDDVRWKPSSHLPPSPHPNPLH